MTGRDLLALVLGVALANYALRLVPLALLRKPLRDPRLVAFIERLPYAILAAMVVPDVFAASTTGDARASAAGFAVALVLSLLGRSLPLVSAAAVAAAFAALALLGA